MGFFSDLFGKSPKKEQPKPPQVEDWLARRERERQERMLEAGGKLKDWILKSVKERGSLNFSWESGGDEAFVTFVDKKESDEDNFEELEYYIIDKLEIPDAGEFKMNGSGKIYIANNEARVEYRSTMKGVVDYNEETQEEIYSEEEQESGDKVLFTI